MHNYGFGNGGPNSKKKKSGYPGGQRTGGTMSTRAYRQHLAMEHGRSGQQQDPVYQQNMAALQANIAQQQAARRGGDLWTPEMGATGGTVTFNNNGYQPTPSVDHISVYNTNANARVSWNVQTGQLAPDHKGHEGPHGYDQTAKKPF